MAGIPATIQLSGTSLVTTEPAAIITFLPIFIFGNIVELVPIKVFSPIKQFPEIETFGQISTKSEITTSCPIEVN